MVDYISSETSSRTRVSYNTQCKNTVSNCFTNVVDRMHINNVYGDYGKFRKELPKEINPSAMLLSRMNTQKKRNRNLQLSE